MTKPDTWDITIAAFCVFGIVFNVAVGYATVLAALGCFGTGFFVRSLLDKS